jgi:hypothetical protein
MDVAARNVTLLSPTLLRHSMSSFILEIILIVVNYRNCPLWVHDYDAGKALQFPLLLLQFIYLSLDLQTNNM